METIIRTNTTQAQISNNTSIPELPSPKEVKQSQMTELIEFTLTALIMIILFVLSINSIINKMKMKNQPPKTKPISVQ